jgi:hypothetical protein
MKKTTLFFFTYLFMLASANAQATMQDLIGGGWNLAQLPEKFLSNTTWNFVGCKMESQYGAKPEAEKSFNNALAGSVWTFAKFEGMDSPKNTYSVSLKGQSETALYNIGMGSLYIDVSGGATWQGQVYIKGNQMCYVHNGFIGDNITCLMTFEKK